MRWGAPGQPRTVDSSSINSSSADVVCMPYCHACNLSSQQEEERAATGMRCGSFSMAVGLITQQAPICAPLPCPIATSTYHC
jgi:hypothetical protein